MDKTKITAAEYPRNLLEAVFRNHEQEAPAEITPDICAGVEYALTLLEERDGEVLRMRYKEKMTLAQIAEILGVQSERVRQLEMRGLRRLYEPQRRIYIKYGIVGFIKRNRETAYQNGYKKGYDEGYREGLDDAPRGIAKEGFSVNIYSLPVESLWLSAKTCECLVEAGYPTIRDLVLLNEKEIIHMDGLTVKRRLEVARGLERYGIEGTAWEWYLLTRKEEGSI